jgi:hypothetical protein
MATIELHVFTNSTVNAPSTNIIQKTTSSLEEMFKKKLTTTVWCDPNPNTAQSSQYISELKNIYPTVEISNGLADGYLQAVKSSESDYLFMVEHDWLFLPSITNTLDEIIVDMEINNLWYLLFNKFHNFAPSHHAPVGDFVRGQHIDFYPTARISNNPHIINKNFYIENAIGYIKPERGGALGIEQELTASPLVGSVYGSQNTTATVYHIDGRKSK